MKRFTPTEKWNEPWFRRLPCKLKAFWEFIRDNCDAAGVWNVDMETASFFLGETVTESEIKIAFGDRIRDLENGKWWIPWFVEFQYGDLKESCKPHQAVAAILKRNSLLTLYKEYRNSSGTVQEKDKDKDKEKDKDKAQSILPLPPPEEEPTEDDLAHEIYELYPLKAAKPDAIRAIKGALKKKTSVFLRERTALYAKAVKGTETLVPHPSTWFNQERYNDDPSTWVRRSDSRNGHHPARNGLPQREFRTGTGNL